MSIEAELLRKFKTLVVVGLSGDPERTSHRVSRYMQQHGYRIIPVNPMEREVLGECSYASLADVPDPLELVDVFRRSEFCADIAREAAAAGAKVLWLQEGVVSSEARAIAEAAGMDYVEDACVMAVHWREERERILGRGPEGM
jgi:uncharacterized protein